MKVETKAIVPIPEMRHDGEISRLESRTDPYDYTDVYFKFEVNGTETELKWGAPTNVTYDKQTKEPRSKLTKLLKVCDIDYTKKEVELDKLIGKKVSFVTTNKKTDKGTFTNIGDDSFQVL